MSLRRSVDRSLIERFLRQVGDRYRRAGRLFLVGGTTLVYEELRRHTLDIDLAIQVADADHDELFRVIRAVRQDLDINVEEASPGHFIPLPAGYADRHVFIRNFGRLEVFHFDPYSTALSKVERGRRQDLQDVLLLLEHEYIAWAELEQHFRAMLPQMERGSLSRDSAEFEKNFRALADQWRAAGGHP